MSAASDTIQHRAPIVILRGVVKTYDGKVRLTVLDAIDLDIEEGEMVAVMGPSGSGKSTLLNLMGGLDVPTSGSVIVAGTDLARESEEGRSLFRRNTVSYVFQAYHLMPTLTAAQNVALPLHLSGLARGEIAQRVRQALDEVGLAGRADHLPDELSGGERQRVAIARAVVTRPRLLLADEPTGNLDSARGEEILQVLANIHRQHGATIVMVTHDSGAASHCRRIIRLCDGRIAGEEQQA